LAPNRVNGFSADELDGRIISCSGLRYVVALEIKKNVLARMMEEGRPILKMPDW